MIHCYRKKPVTIEAVQWTGENLTEIEGFAGEALIEDYTKGEEMCVTLYLKTLEGKMKASVGSYIIKGVNGEFYACDPDVFAKTYDCTSIKMDSECESGESDTPAWVSRMRKEYHELKARYEKLHAMLIKYNAGTLDFKPNCSIEVLTSQKLIMREYLDILELRAEIEGVEL